MLFTSAALVILAHSAAILAAPTAPSASTSAAAAATTAAAPASTGLSLTQKLFIADTAVDRFALLPDDKQFVFDFNQPQAGAGKGGELVAANRKTFPALVGTGSGMAVGRVKPCGMNTLHVHPRATELQIVTQGRLITAMTPENGVLNANGKGRRVIQNEVKAYQMTPFYQGSVHTQFNPDCTDALFVASFNAEDFGAGQVVDEITSFSDDILEAAFGQSVDGADIDRIRAAVPVSIAEGVEQCLKTCNIPKRA
ncbi:RmlC-like cupin [Coniochaeta ligniaria NRRL 30616]|uniref:RmlC-like cupin n=1 Tax=Coniochaeta ligniaria NRRL 30616 TaxID=1408157 RepID=A0A1J7JL49_9PEZI|nr:RmlC-like cupin [Coniochaeta ligniaria NRRL 30616]